MKKAANLRILLFVLLFVSGNMLSAQVNISVKAGVNGTWITNPTFDNYNVRPGFNLGLSARNEIVPQLFALEVESGISNENSTGDLELGIFHARHKVNLDYWNTALLTHFKITETLKAHAGMQYGYLLLARSDFQRELGINSNNIATYKFNPHNWSVVIGIEKVTPGNLSFGARYTHGLDHMTPFSFNDVIFNSIPPENFLEHSRNFQIYVKRKIFGNKED